MSHVTVGIENSTSIDLYYEDHGEGKPVVLIHGGPLSGASWEKQVPALMAAGYRVITYDRRGFGFSSKPAFGYEYSTLTEDLHRLVTKLDLRDATLVGFSMGGGEVAHYFGVYGADRVSRAVFMASIPPFLLKTADNPKGAEGAMFEEIQKAIQKDRPAFLASFLQNFYNVDVLKGTRISDEGVRMNWNIGVSASPRATLDCVQAWLTDFREDLKRIKVPTLIVHGDADRITPIAVTGERIHEAIPGSQLVVMEGGPHGLNWTHAEEVNRALLAFLGK